MTDTELMCIELPGLLLSAAAVDKLGRKLSMSTMFFMCCIFLLPLIFYLPEGLTTSLLFGARICITATFTILYIYAPEVMYLCKIILNDLVETVCIRYELRTPIYTVKY